MADLFAPLEDTRRISWGGEGCAGYSFHSRRLLSGSAVIIICELLNINPRLTGFPPVRLLSLFFDVSQS